MRSFTLIVIREFRFYYNYLSLESQVLVVKQDRHQRTWQHYVMDILAEAPIDVDWLPLRCTVVEDIERESPSPTLVHRTRWHVILDCPVL